MKTTIFQPTPNPDSKRLKQNLEDAFAFLIQHSGEGDYTRLFDAIQSLKVQDRTLWRSLRAHHLTRAIFDLVDLDDAFRCGRTPDQRRG